MSEGRIVRQNFSTTTNIRKEQAKDQVSEIIKDSKTVDTVSQALDKVNASYATSAINIKQDPVLISETCSLPSKGLLYNGVIGDTLEFRAMTTVEERMRLSGQNFWSTMSSIMNRCLVNNNSNFDVKNLVDFDFFAALVKLRTITYGNIYKTTGTCLSCEDGKEVDVDLDNVVVTTLPDDFKEPIELGPLPRSGDILGLRFLRVFDHIDIANKVNDYNSKHKKNDLGSPEYTLEMEKMIVTVNGNELDSMAKHIYVENMNGMDSSYFHKKIEKLFYGVHRIGTCKCPSEDCDGLVIYQIAPDESFFRATFDD